MTLDAATPLLLIGAGKMGGALLAGWIEAGLDAAETVVVDPHITREMGEFLAGHGIRHLHRLRDVEPPRVLVIAVKPQVIDSVLAELAPLAGVGSVAVSIAAGTRIARLEAGLGGRCGVVRAMPNTPAQIGRGMTVAFANARVDENQRAVVEALLETVGGFAWVDDESLLDPVTAVSGSGPAYVFLLAECLAEAGVAAGLPDELAMRLARETIGGAGELLCRSPLDPASLRKNVTSPGGTTAAALEVLMGRERLARLLREAVAAATRRSRELAG